MATGVVGAHACLWRWIRQESHLTFANEAKIYAAKWETMHHRNPPGQLTHERTLRSKKGMTEADMGLILHPGIQPAFFVWLPTLWHGQRHADAVKERRRRRNVNVDK